MIDPAIAALRPYRSVLVGFGFFLLLMGATAAALFVMKLGISAADIEAYYRGSEARFTRPRTLTGLLEVAVPHLAAIPVVAFITLHLVTFARVLDARFSRNLARLSFAVVAGSIAAGFAVRYVAPSLSWMKLLTFVAFEALMAFWLGLVVRLIWRTYFTKATLSIDRSKSTPLAN